MADTKLLANTQIIYGWRIVNTNNEDANPYYAMPIDDQMPGDDDFNSFDEAMNYLETQSEVTDTSNWIMVKTTIQEVIIDDNDLEAPPSVIITGSLADGLHLVGPFLTTDDAVQHAGTHPNINKNYWEAFTLEAPTTNN